MTLALTRLRGFQDLIGPDAAAVAFVEERARVMAGRYNLREIRIPMMERIGLYQRSTGETSDIVTKQMYAVKRSEESQGEDEMILRPEGTPGVVRSYIEFGLDRRDPYQRFFYSGPMLRYEKPQKGRYRQFNQFGVEILGRSDATCDAELMIMIDDLMRDLDIRVLFKINSLGHDIPNCKPRFKEALLEYGCEHFEELCVDCRQRLKRNPIRLLDCKIDAERVARLAPKSTDFLCDECISHFNTVKRLLSEANVPFIVEPSLVRGLDYYTRTAFEVVSSAVGRSQNALAAGGRYDGLVKELGGSDIPGSGFAIGIERTALVLEREKYRARMEPDVALAGLGELANVKVMEIAHELRNEGLRVEVLPSDRKPRGALTVANRMGARLAAVIGENELSANTVRIRHLKQSVENEIKLDQIVPFLCESTSKQGREASENAPNLSGNVATTISVAPDLTATPYGNSVPSLDQVFQLTDPVTPATVSPTDTDAPSGKVLFSVSSAVSGVSGQIITTLPSAPSANR
jgi:histidyl-tRNA synthetase